jgi:hypothetical protein
MLPKDISIGQIWIKEQYPETKNKIGNTSASRTDNETEPEAIRLTKTKMAID